MIPFRVLPRHRNRLRGLTNWRQTSRQFHVYLQPDRAIEEEAMRVHGITNDFSKISHVLPTSPMNFWHSSGTPSW
ncbi:MAG: hypothetical protein U1F42_01195 [Candidatus Competibacteraceae bacterium]